MAKTYPNWIICGLLFILSTTIYLQGLSIHGLEYRDDEIFYFKSTEEMLNTGDYLSPKYFSNNRFEKPILYYWFILFGYKLFGFGWFGARFFSVILGAATIVLTWAMAKDMFNRRMATLSAFILMTIPLFMRHAKNAVPDMALNFFIVLACYFAVQYLLKEERFKYSFWFFVSCALGFMIKGFAAFIAPIGTVLAYCLINKKYSSLKNFGFGRGIVLMLAIILPWFFYMVNRHGMPYFDHMFSNETAYRLMGVNESSIILSKLKSFVEHLGFYSYVLLTFFAPWGILTFIAFPWVLVKKKKDAHERASVHFLCSWFLVVFLFFSFMYFTITHYILVLSTPFAILLSFFLLDPKQEGGRIVQRFLQWFPKGFMCFALFILFVVLAFICVFMAQYHPAWLILIGSVGVCVLVWSVKAKDKIVAPLLLSICLLFLFGQTHLQAKLGLSTISKLQDFAQYLHTQDTDDYVIAVGSNDIHEKEWQVYFDTRLFKPAEWHRAATEIKLRKMFNETDKFYCLIIKKDFDDFLPSHYHDKVEVVKEDFIIRKRFFLDKEFVKALFRFDQPVIHSYFYEKILLVKKG